ncbi:MAG: riboflavin synthase [Tissierellia bacterium]|nr:riboflavin synthase [Tissierellia bacterium]
MFTGISEEMGKIEAIKRSGDTLNLKISANKVLKDIKIGDSIMADGVCLTVTEFTDSYFKADLMKESQKASKFDMNMLNKYVNLERALKISDRLDGHIVQGHIDGVGKIVSIRENVFRIRTSREISKYIVRKGSICIDGISLTVSYENNDDFEVSLILETLKNTNFKYKKVMDKVNLETDIWARFVEKLMKNEKRMDRNFLLENGF